MKRIFILLNLILCLLLASCDLNINFSPSNPSNPTNPSDPSDTKDFVDIDICSVNDLHGSIVPNSTTGHSLCNVSAEINDIKNKDDLDNTVLIANGDMFQETAISYVSKGYAIVECMNQMGFDCMGVGNHEFDWGLNTILNYFDGDTTNGEARFPLINSNIKEKSNNEYITKENVKPYTIVSKMGVNIGIISLIGDIASSIDSRLVEPYEFDTNFATRTKELGLELRSLGCDVIICNIHAGNSNGVEQYSPNSTISKLKDNDGRQLVNAIINGHTHTIQKGLVNGIPVVQGGSNGRALGYVNLKVNTSTHEVTTNSYNYVESSLTKSDYYVEAAVSQQLNKYDADINTPYCTSDFTSTGRYNMKNYCLYVMLKAFDGDIATMTNTSIRNSGSFVAGSPITFVNMYQVFPFDNKIVTVRMKGSVIYESIINDSYKSYVTKGIEIENDKYYRVVISDYNYYGSYFTQYQNSTAVQHDYLIRDLMIEDLSLRTTFNYSNIKSVNDILIPTKAY